MQSEIYTSLPCLIQSFNPAKRTVTAQPTIKAQAQNPDGSFQWIALPILPDVPVYFPEGGGVTLTFPIQSGDEALVVIANRCIDAWWQSGGIQVQADIRMHSLSDGFAFVGISSVPRVISNISTSRAQLRSNDGQAFVELDPTSHFIRVRTTGKFEANADSDILIKSGTRIDLQAPIIQGTATTSFGAAAPLINFLGNMTWAGPGGGAGTVTMGNMTVNWSSSTLNLLNTSIAATGGTLTHNTKSFGSTHTHGGVATGAGTSGAPNN
jgi:hypothetical protein